MNEPDVYDFLRHWGERTQQGPSAEDWPKLKSDLREVERRAAAVRMHFAMVYESEHEAEPTHHDGDAP